MQHHHPSTEYMLLFRLKYVIVADFTMKTVVFQFFKSVLNTTIFENLQEEILLLEWIKHILQHLQFLVNYRWQNLNTK
jgi:hypothetical protein